MYDKYAHKYVDLNRGWGTDLFKNASTFSSTGTIRKLATMREDKTWILNTKGKEILKQYRELFEKNIA